MRTTRKLIEILKYQVPPEELEKRLNSTDLAWTCINFLCCELDEKQEMIEILCRELQEQKKCQ